MIPGHPTNTTYRTIAQKDFGVFMCAAQEGCPKGLGWRAHWYGRVDRVGWIHWKQADKRATRKGMRHFMKLMGMAHNRAWWTLPVWQRLYLTNAWATNQTRKRYHFRIPSRWSVRDRREAARLAFRAKRKNGSYRWNYHNFYVWALNAGLSPDTGVQSPVQEGVQPPA